jgi:DNA-binding transcriptional LysR family regulator
MKSVDLNLLIALDVLLAEGSVTAAARQLGLSTSAMSRTLTRLRASTGDPLLVRAGRGLVPTPYAAALRDRVHSVTNEARTVLRPATTKLDMASLDSTFTVRASESFMEMLSSALVAAVTKVAPQVRLRFVPKRDRDPQVFREGLIDLEIGRRGTSGPEMRTQVLFRDRYVGVARVGHPLLIGGAVTPKRFAACNHVVASQAGGFGSPLDNALEELEHRRAVHVMVPGFPDAMRVAGNSDLIALVPRSSLGNAFVKDQAAVLGVRSFDIPVRIPHFPISAMWHPRVDADPAQRWFRQQVIAVCRLAYPAEGRVET